MSMFHGLWDRFYLDVQYMWPFSYITLHRHARTGTLRDQRHGFGISRFLLLLALFHSDSNCVIEVLNNALLLTGCCEDNYHQHVNKTHFNGVKLEQRPEKLSSLISFIWNLKALFFHDLKQGIRAKKMAFAAHAAALGSVCSPHLVAHDHKSCSMGSDSFLWCS